MHVHLEEAKGSRGLRLPYMQIELQPPGIIKYDRADVP